MIQHFLDYIAVERKYSELTVSSYRDDLTAFCAFLGWGVEEFDPAQVDEQDIRLWINYLGETNHAPTSIRRYLSSLRSFYRFLLCQGKVKRDITRRIVAPKVEKRLPSFFKTAEMQAATQYNQQADDFPSLLSCLVIEMLYQTGMRRAELVNLQDKDVDLDAAQVRIFGKRKKERIVPMGDNLIALIRQYLEARHDIGGDACGSFFVYQRRDGAAYPMTASCLYRIVTNRMGEVSTMHKHSPHVLRHTFATAMLNQGADIRTIQKLLGHSSLAATQVYTHTTFEQIRQAYQNAHPRAIRKDK